MGRVMLSEEHHELLSAYVDGEVGARQRKTVLRLLRKSAEARKVVRQMQEHARILRTLPRQPSKPEFELRILQAFVDRQADPEPVRTAVPEPATLPLWLAVTAAAAVLLAFTLGSYIYFTSTPSSPRNPTPHVKEDKSSTPALQPQPDAPGDQAPATRPVDNAFVGPQLPKETPSDPPELVLAPRPAISDEPSRDPEVLAAPAPIEKKELFRAADVKIPALIKLHELDEEKPREQLREELKKATAFRLELPYRESSARAFQRVRSVLEGNSIGLVVDQVAQARLNYPQVKTHYVLYLEDVTPDELARIIQQLGLEDKKADVKLREFTKMVAAPLNDGDRKEMSQLLGVDPRQLLPPGTTTQLGLDIRKPLSETTGNQVLLVMTGQGGVPRPEPGKPVVKPPERLALALAYNPVRPRPNSPEVRRFLDSRKQPREGTLQVLLVLRDAS